MAIYNTFVAIDCKKRKPILVTSSARKASKLLKSGVRIEVWNENQKVETLYESQRKREGNPMNPYIALEREYIQKKQERRSKNNGNLRILVQR